MGGTGALMANPNGRPRGTGGKPTKHATSERNAAANRVKAKLPRPGRRKDTPAEKLRAYKAEAIGRRLCFDSLDQVSRYLRANELIQSLLDSEAAKNVPDPILVVSLAAQRIPLPELVSVMRESHNRWGQPPRSVLEVEGADRPPVMVMAPFGQWESREDAHAAAAAGSNGHADGHSKH